MRTHRRGGRRAVGLLTLFLGACTLSLALPGSAEAQAGQPTVTDNVAYPATPQAQLGAGCDSGGLLGVTFRLDAGPPQASLSALGPLEPGNAVIMSWTGVSAACVGTPAVLAIKDAPTPFFDIGAVQPLVLPYSKITLVEGPGTLTFVLPFLASFEHDCAYQLDAIVGIPLAIVGPLAQGGSYYSAVLRGDGLATTLIGSANGAYPACLPPPTTTTSTVPDTSTSSPTTSTTVPVVTTQPTTSTSSPPTPPSSVVIVTIPTASTTTFRSSTISFAPVAPTTATSRPVLAATGAHGSPLLTLLAVVLLAGGVILIFVNPERRHAR